MTTDDNGARPRHIEGAGGLQVGKARAAAMALVSDDDLAPWFHMRVTSVLD
jgi:hypothetical protein